MPTDQSQSKRQGEGTSERDQRTANPTSGTETEQKGGSDNAKRQAERDWQNSAKESGE